MVKFLGNTDEVDTCDCCGRKDLKSTVALELTEGAEPVYYGVTCAALALSRTPKDIRSESKKADEAKAAVERAAYYARVQAEQAPWFAFLALRGTGRDNFTRIESLGGYTSAKALYNASL